MKISTLLIGLMLIANCTVNSDLRNNNDEPKNDLEREYLYGPVKELKQFKSNFTDSKNLKSEKPIIEFRKQYSNFGNISYVEYYDDFSKIKQYRKNEYNRINKKVSSISENYHYPSVISESYVYNGNGNPINYEFKINDTVQAIGKFEYDSLGKLIKQFDYQNNDSTITIFIHKYNKSGKISSALNKEIHCGDTLENVTNYKYDTKSRLIELLRKSYLIRYKSHLLSEICEYYESNHIVKKTEYQSEQLKEETIYDIRHNPTNIKYFENSAITKELKFAYKFDRFGNWIEKKVEENENSKDPNGYLPIYIQTREIEYNK